VQQFKGHQGWVNSVSVSPDGKEIVLFRVLVPRIVEIKHLTHAKKRFVTDKLLKNDLRLTSSTYRNNVDVDILDKDK